MSTYFQQILHSEVSKLHDHLLIGYFRALETMQLMKHTELPSFNITMRIAKWVGLGFSTSTCYAIPQVCRASVY